MFLERSSRAAFPFVPWEDTFHFHARLFRCFLLHFLSARSELGSFSQGAERIWIVLGQGFVDVGLERDHGADQSVHEHERDSRRALSQCPPKRRYESAVWPLAVTDPLMDQTVFFPPFIPPVVHHHDANLSRFLHDVRPVGAVDDVGIPGECSTYRMLKGADGLVSGAGILAYLLLWSLALAIVVLRSRAPSDIRAVCRLTRMAVDSTTNVNSGERVARSLAGTRRLVHLRVDRYLGRMPSAWSHERRQRCTLHVHQASVSRTIPWILFHLYARMGITSWVYFPGLAFVFGVLSRVSNGMVTIEREPECSDSAAPDELDLDADISDMLDGTQAVLDHLTPHSGPSIRNPHESTMEFQNRRCGPLAMDDVAVKESADPARTLDSMSGPRVGLTFTLEASDIGNRELYPEGIPSNGDENTSDNGSDGSFFRPAIRRTDEQDECPRLDRWEDGVLSNPGFPLLLRRASNSDLWRKLDVFEDDDDETTGDGSCWIDQIDAGTCRERYTRQGWSDGSLWPPEGQGDRSNNWRVRGPQVTYTATPEQCPVDGNRSRLRRYSSPPLHRNPSPSHLAGSGNGPPGIYVVPQKRGARCWPLVSTLPPSDDPSGLGFLPSRKTPSLLTPESWRPGCLYVPDPPVDECKEAKAWLDRVPRGGTSATEHAVGTGTGLGLETGGVPTFSRDIHEGFVSWRDKYENDPASRRIMAGHRRAATKG